MTTQVTQGETPIFDEVREALGLALVDLGDLMDIEVVEERPEA